MNKCKRIAECIGGVATLLQSILWISLCVVGVTVIKLNNVAGKEVIAPYEYNTIFITLAVCAVVAFISGSIQMYPPYVKSRSRYNDKKVYNALSSICSLIVGIVSIVNSAEIARLNTSYNHMYTVIGVIALVSVIPSLIGLVTKHRQPAETEDNIR